MENIMYQVSTLQALALGYSRSVMTVEELIKHGDTGLGTFEDVNGEMIFIDGKCFRATNDGSVTPAELSRGVPFASVSSIKNAFNFKVQDIKNISALKDTLNLKIEEDFGLNSMHLCRIDGDFDCVQARSETGRHSHHVSLKEVLDGNQKDFTFENIKGSLVAVYHPDYMDGINAPGWHFHFISEDRSKGGHVFEINMKSGTVYLSKIMSIQIQLPREPAFDTYSLKQASANEIKQVEQGGKNGKNGN